jgi:acyl-CoA thioesterase-1
MMKNSRSWRFALPAVQVVAIASLVNLALAVFPMRASAEIASPIRIVAFGDSLTAGYGLAQSEAFPEQLSRALKAKGYDVDMTNAGVSGDTTAAGLERFAWAVPEGTEAVILELGANDALRGLDPKETRANLEKTVTKLKAQGIEVLLAGMRSPGNWGDAYRASFDRIYPDLAEANGLILYPFFLEGVAAHKGLNLDDGLHPSAKGVAIIVERILPSVEKLIDRVKARRAVASKS